MLFAFTRRKQTSERSNGKKYLYRRRNAWKNRIVRVEPVGIEANGRQPSWSEIFIHADSFEVSGGEKKKVTWTYAGRRQVNRVRPILAGARSSELMPRAETGLARLLRMTENARRWDLSNFWCARNPKGISSGRRGGRGRKRPLLNLGTIRYIAESRVIRLIGDPSEGRTHFRNRRNAIDVASFPVGTTKHRWFFNHLSHAKFIYLTIHYSWNEYIIKYNPSLGNLNFEQSHRTELSCRMLQKLFHN